MADDLVDGRAYGLREPVVSKASWDGILNLHDVVMTDFIEGFSRHSRHYKRLYEFKNLSSKTAGNAHFGQLFCASYFYSHDRSTEIR